MPPTANTSSAPAPEPAGPLRRVPLMRLRPHPANANVMPAERRAKLAANIERQAGTYPPLVVRPHPTDSNAYQVLDGHQRLLVLGELGHTHATCFVWPCDDATALRLLATLNRLEGADAPYKRAALLQELCDLLPPAELALLLPEDAGLIADTLALLDCDADALEAELAAAEARAAPTERALTFVLPLPEADAVEAAVAAEAERQSGRNRRGQALASLVRRGRVAAADA